MPIPHVILGRLGPAIALACAATNAPAFTRPADPPAVPTAAVPWLGPAITGAIAARAEPPMTVARPRGAVEASPPPAGGPEPRWVDPPRRGFDFPLRGSI